MNISLNITLMRSNYQHGFHLHRGAWQSFIGVLVGRGLDEEGVLALGLSYALKGIICELRLLETQLLSRFLDRYHWKNKIILTLYASFFKLNNSDYY